MSAALRRSEHRPGRGATWALAALLAASAALSAGCGLVLPGRAVSEEYRLPAGRVLVVARAPGEGNEAVALDAERLLVRRLRSTGGADVVGSERLVAEVAATPLVTAGAATVEAIRLGAHPLAPEHAAVLAPLAVAGVLVVTVDTWEQVWGKYGKFTRVGVEAVAYDLPKASALWRVRGAVDLEGKRGRAFQYALEDAVGMVADGIQPRPGPRVSDLWRAWRR